MHRRLILSSFAVIVLAACGSSTTAAPTTTAAPAATTTAAAPDTSAPATTSPATTAATTPAGSGETVQVATTGLGKILVDQAGLTVYMFQKDTPTTSACTAACAQKWPAVTGPETVGAGLDKTLLTTITGDAGVKQLAYNGHPLYYFAGDSKPGDTNGQKVGGVWFVLDATGTPITG